MPELSTTWPGRIKQGMTYALRLPKMHRSVSTGRPMSGPIAVAFYLGPKCNLSCAHCGFHGEGDPVAFHDYERVIQELHAMGARELTLTGGEPTLVKGFSDYLSLPVSLGWTVGFTTNGTAMKGTLLDAILATGVQRISISLDGLQPAHDAVRGEGTFKRAMEGLDNLLEKAPAAGVQIRVNMVLLRHNLEDVLPLHARMAARKVWFNLMPFTSDNLSYHQQSVDAGHALDATALKRMDELFPQWLTQRRTKGYWLNTKAHLEEIRRFNRTGERQGTCLVGAYQFNVDEKLRVGFCTEEIGVIGDLNLQSASDIWQGQAAAAARKRVGACKACALNCYYTPTLPEAVFDLMPVLIASR